jgi:hypothetical protein
LNGLNWLTWLLVFALLAAFTGVGGWWYRQRRRDAAEALAESSP